MAVSMQKEMTLPVGSEARSITLSGSPEALSEQNVVKCTALVIDLLQKWQTLSNSRHTCISTFATCFKNVATIANRFVINNKENIGRCYFLLDKIGIHNLDDKVLSRISEIKAPVQQHTHSSQTTTATHTTITDVELVELKCSLKGLLKSLDVLNEHVNELSQPYNMSISRLSSSCNSFDAACQHFKISTQLSITHPDVYNMTPLVQKEGVSMARFINGFSVYFSATATVMDSADKMIQRITTLSDQAVQVVNQLDLTSDVSYPLDSFKFNV